MKKHKIGVKIVLISLVATLVIAAGTMALTNPEIPRYFLGAGGQSTGGGYILADSIGQHDASGSMHGGNYSMTGGFWSRVGEAKTDFFVYLPLVIK